MKTQLLQLSAIVTTAGTQIRASINHDSVDEYANAMTDGAKFPPIVVFHDGNDYILADGFHRVMAASRNGFKDIEAEVRKGTKQDALKYALGANSAHGIKRTNADKRRSVELALAEWPKFSSNEIARICAVGNHLVDDVRNSQLGDSPSSQAPTRIGRDGKERKLPERKPAVHPLEPDEPEVSQHSQAGESFAKALGFKSVSEAASAVEEIATKPTEPPVTEYYNRLEALTEDAVENASLKQLQSMTVAFTHCLRRIKQTITERSKKK